MLYDFDGFRLKEPKCVRLSKLSNAVSLDLHVELEALCSCLQFAHLVFDMSAHSRLS